MRLAQDQPFAMMGALQEASQRPRAILQLLTAMPLPWALTQCRVSVLRHALSEHIRVQRLQCALRAPRERRPTKQEAPPLQMIAMFALGELMEVRAR